MNRLRFISQVVYRLKRRYGEAIDIVYRTSDVTNLETGRKTITKNSRRVNRAIVLPSAIDRVFSYDLAFIATNKNFTYGGHYDTTERRFIIDRKDIPGLELTLDMYLLFAGNRYDLKEIQEFEESTSYFVIGKQAIEADAESIIYTSALSSLSLDSTSGGTL